MEFTDLFVITIWGLFLLLTILKLVSSILIVPQRTALVVERLGRYSKTLHSGFHILVPWIDKVAASIDLREVTVDVPPQECFTKDEIKVVVDGVLYLSVIDPVKATYGVTDFKMAAMQLAQTTTRSVIGKLQLDRTFEERQLISSAVVTVLDQTAAAWGIHVHRYEIKNLQPPQSVKNAMEKQVRAERERKALVAKAEGDKQSRINRSEGHRLELINTSVGEKKKLMNDADGKASEIRALADANARSIENLSKAITDNKGERALWLKLVTEYMNNVGQIAKKNTKVVLPMDLSQVESMSNIVSSLHKR